MSKKKLWGRSVLCVIVDRETCGNRILNVVKAAVRGGAGIIQYRDKTSSVKEVIRTADTIKKITRSAGRVLIINDRPEVVSAIDADGVHLGQGDLSVRAARRVLGKDKLIGVSATTLAQARQAAAGGADYIGAGPIFATPVKKQKAPKGLRLLKSLSGMSVPVIAIGGIGYRNAYKLFRAGFRNIAVIREVCASREPENAVIRLMKAISR